jgi:hypothetical protein
MSDADLSYARGMLSVEQLRSEVSNFWHELEYNSDLRFELSEHGIDCDTFIDIATSRRIMISVGRSGVDPTETILIVAFAPTANRILKDIWGTVLLPRLRRRWGEDAVGKEKDTAG